LLLLLRLLLLTLLLLAACKPLHTLTSLLQDTCLLVLRLTKPIPLLLLLKPQV
jgi:hypothetical protein